MDLRRIKLFMKRRSDSTPASNPNLSHPVDSGSNPAWVDAAIAGSSIAIMLLMLFTGGRRSVYSPLMFAPFICAAFGSDYRRPLTVGVAISTFYLLLGGSGRLLGFDSAQVIQLLAIAIVTGLGVLSARASNRARNELIAIVREKDALLDVSQMVNACDKLEYALNSALLMLRAMIPDIRCAAIYLMEPGDEQLSRVAEIGQLDILRAPRSLTMDGLPQGWSLGSDSPFEAHTVRDAGCPDEGANSEAYHGWYLSLRSLNVPFGMVYVETDREKSDSSAIRRMLIGFVERIGFPLQKIRLQEGLHNLAFTDPMTGLCNHRAFRRHLGEEWKRAVRYHRPLSTILLDLDGFKGVNDRFGHQAGDRVLSSLAEILKANLRETDIPARYGGEEFVVICPETPESEAILVAERIRTSVESAQFELTDNESTSITCSLGVAAYPVHALYEEALIDAADAALYCAKRSGKNRVYAAGSLPYLARDAGG